MEFIAIERGPGALQEPLTLDQIHAISERTFGPGVTVTSVRELGGGEFNTVYRIGLVGNQSVILRVAPPPTRALPWHEADLMRHEHARRDTWRPFIFCGQAGFLVEGGARMLEQ